MPPRKKTTGNARCKFCGKQQLHSKRKDCPAYNQKCGFCKKWHHFASVCTAAKKGKVHLQEENCERSEQSMIKVEEIFTVESSDNRWIATLRPKTQLKCQNGTGDYNPSIEIH